MIALVNSSKGKLELRRTVSGSFDCLYSVEYSEITSFNLGTLASVAYWGNSDDIKKFIEDRVRLRKSDPNTPYVFRNSGGLKGASYIGSFEHSGTLSTIDTQGFCFEDAENLYIAFRGTEPTKIRDWLTDLDGKSVKAKFCHGNVHGGFHAALDAVLPKLKTILDARDKNKNVVICGHSLGGALATLCAAWVRETYTSKVMLYTYGSPRAGCRDFVDHYTKAKPFPAFRVANPTDLVPSVPWDTASRDARRASNAPLVVLSPLGWIVVARDEIREHSDSMRYKHLGTPVSMQPSGFSIVGQAAYLDGEFAAGVQKDWEQMSLPEFVKSRMNNINHHFMTEYLPRLRKDFLDDCRNWAHGDPKPFQTKLNAVEAKLTEVEAQLRRAREAFWKTHPKADRDATNVRTPHLPASGTDEPEVSPEARVRDLEAHRNHLRAQEALLKDQIAESSSEGRKHSLWRISRRPFDGYLEEELLAQAG